MGILNPFSQTASLAAGDEVLHELFTALGGGGGAPSLPSHSSAKQVVQSEETKSRRAEATDLRSQKANIMSATRIHTQVWVPPCFPTVLKQQGAGHVIILVWPQRKQDQRVRALYRVTVLQVTGSAGGPWNFRVKQDSSCHLIL
jgi:hypothetical protein